MKIEEFQELKSRARFIVPISQRTPGSSCPVISILWSTMWFKDILHFHISLSEKERREKGD